MNHPSARRLIREELNRAARAIKALCNAMTRDDTDAVVRACVEALDDMGRRRMAVAILDARRRGRLGLLLRRTADLTAGEQRAVADRLMISMGYMLDHA